MRSDSLDSPKILALSHIAFPTPDKDTILSKVVKNAFWSKLRKAKGGGGGKITI